MATPNVNCFTFSWEGQTLLSGSQDKTIRVWRLCDSQS
ncbi:MAG TPA: hypothetical protein DCE56_21365 [Cyanobacteria bacterium UBA8553]|nr:hypothetical protein [Cyanobacteria bacterium UBA8553]